MMRINLNATDTYLESFKLNGMVCCNDEYEKNTVLEYLAFKIQLCLLLF